MADRNKFRSLLSGLSPWIVIGAVLVLLPIVASMTVATIHRQKQQSIRLMLEKGAALIRSFEAGTRMGMRGGHGRGFQLQRLLVETAAQTDIAYLQVVDVDGTVIAHSQPDQVGTRYTTDLNLHAIHAAGDLRWRPNVSAAGDSVFEIYGKFAPLDKRPHRPRRSRMMDMMEIAPDRPEPPPMLIFVGLRTDAVDAARAAGIRHTVVMAAVLLLVGLTGVLLLFMAQNYRSTRSSLVRVKAFSDDLVTRMPIGLVALDRDNRVTAVNSFAESTLGVSADAAIGTNVEAVMPQELCHLLSETVDLVEKEVSCPVADGRHVLLDFSAASLTDEDGGRFGKVILFKDLTEIRALRLELEKNRRLASVGRLAAGVAHEIRNPLSSIKGFATYFKAKYRQSDKDQEVATIMIQEVDRLNRVVGQLLDFSRPIRLHFQKVAVKPFIEDAFRLVEDQGRANGVAMALEMPDETLGASVDVDRMRQVMLNLLLNALDAMASGGRLTVRATGDGNGTLRLTVADSGAGIAPEDLPHIFEPYFSTKRSGTGLGLAIVHNIVQAHGGTIAVESRTGAGTTITMTLPSPKEV